MIVPATDGPATLADCLAAIAAADAPPEEVVVVEDSGLAGAAAARNLGVSRSTGELLVFVDADVIVRRDVFSRIREAFDGDPELTAIFGSYDDTPAAAGPVSGFRNLLHHYVHQQAGGTARTFWAGLGAIRRSAFERLGGFVDHPIEDIELGMRLSASGGRIRLDPQIQGCHTKAWSLRTMVRTDLLVRGAPWVDLLLRQRSMPAALNLGWRHRLSALASLSLLAAAALLSAPIAVGAFVALLALNLPFYRLLVRRRGGWEAAVGVVLHVIHHLVAVAALLLGVTLFAVRRRAGSDAVSNQAGSQAA